MIVLQAGTYRGDLGFGGKNVTVRGVGSRTKLRGTGTGPVVSFNSGEGRDAVLDSVRVVGGRAEQGAGVYISGASPTIVRSVIFKNRAVESGSGIYVGANSSPLIANNVISRNRRTNNSGDPHAIQVEDGTPDIYNNTIIRNDSNGIFLTGSAAADIRNNIIAFNGHRRLNRGRGICDFSSASSTIQYNIFFRNIIGALLLGRDFDRISNAERTLNLSRIADNLDANPRVRSVVQGRLRRRSAAVNRGDPADSYLDSDGSRNDIGATGGPFAR